MLDNKDTSVPLKCVTEELLLHDNAIEKAVEHSRAAYPHAPASSRRQPSNSFFKGSQ